MLNKCFKKGLAVLIILIFLGLVIHPVLSNEIPSVVKSNIEEDYFEFQLNRWANLAEKFLKYRENPEDRPICELLLKYGSYFDDLRHFYFNLSLYNPDNLIYSLVFIIYSTITINIFTIGVMLDCWDDPFNPYY